jgi:hypothetical protein
MKLPPHTHWTGDWVGPRASMDILEKWKVPCLCQELNFGSSIPYWLHYPSSSIIIIIIIIVVLN